MISVAEKDKRVSKRQTDCMSEQVPEFTVESSQSLDMDWGNNASLFQNKETSVFKLSV